MREVTVLKVTPEDRQLDKHDHYDFIYYNVKGIVWYIIKNTVTNRIGKIQADELMKILDSFKIVEKTIPEEVKKDSSKKEKKKSKEVEPEAVIMPVIESVTEEPVKIEVPEISMDEADDLSSSYDDRSDVSSDSSDSFSGNGGDFGGGGSSGDF